MVGGVDIEYLPLVAGRTLLVLLVLSCCVNHAANYTQYGQDADDMGDQIWHYSPDRSPYEELMEDFWAWRMQQVPEFSTTVGVHSHDDKLETFTLEAFTHRKEKADEFLFRIDIMDKNLLTYRERRNLALLRDDIQVYADGYRWSRLVTLNPINFLEGLHKDFTYWQDAVDFRKGEDFRIYIQRLRALATQVYEQIALMREAIRTGWINHRLSMEPVIPFLEEIIDREAMYTPFFKPFNDSLEVLDFSDNKVERLRAEGQAVIEDQVLPAYRKLKRFLTQEYLPKTRHQIGIYSLPAGEDYYHDCIKWYLASDDSPNELHNWGIQEVRKIRIRMDQIRKSMGYMAGLDSFIRYMHKAAKFFFIQEDEILKEYEMLVTKRIPPRLKWVVRNITMSPLIVLPMPFDGPLGVAVPPSEDKTMPGMFFVNVRRPHKRPKWMMISIVLQKTYPGHYFQESYALNQSIPRFRRIRDFRKMYSVPFQFPSNIAYTEGWSLYAGSLGQELGLYSNPNDEFGQLYIELNKIIKIVVDTGIHAKGWSREYAINYMTTNTGISHRHAAHQVDTFITLPAQALGDSVGMLKIKLLRKKAEQLLGDMFDVKEFHHQILKLGPVSLHTLQKSVNTWLSYLVPDHLTSSAPSWQHSILYYNTFMTILTLIVQSFR